MSGLTLQTLELKQDINEEVFGHLFEMVQTFWWWIVNVALISETVQYNF